MISITRACPRGWGDYCWLSGNIRTPSRYFQKAIAIREKLIGPDSLELADVLQSYGVTLHDQRKYAEAEKVLPARDRHSHQSIEAPMIPLPPRYSTISPCSSTISTIPPKPNKYYRESLRIRETALARRRSRQNLHDRES